MIWRLERLATATRSLLVRDQVQFACILLIGALAFAPSLFAGFFWDDHLQNAMLSGTYPVPRTPWNLYDFMQASELPVFRARGVVPWWADAQLTLRFLRPLPSLLRSVTYWIWGRQATAEHLLSLGLWAAVIGMAYAWLRDFLPTRRALLAAAMLAWAPAHIVALCWVANREALLSLLLGVLALRTQRAFLCESGNRVRLWGRCACAIVAYVASLASGEYAVAFGGYAVLVPLWGFAHTSKPRRTLAVLAFALPLLAYLALRKIGGYGARATGFYDDPFVQPWVFLQAFPRRFSILAAELWGSLDPETQFAHAHNVYAALGLAAAVLLGIVVWREGSAAAGSARREAQALFVGSWLALVPFTCVVPAPRVLGVALLGAAPLISLALTRLGSGSAANGAAVSSPRAQFALLLVAFFQLVHAPLVAISGCRNYMVFTRRFSARERAYAATLPLANETAAASAGSVLSILLLRGSRAPFFLTFAMGRIPPRQFATLSDAPHVLLLRTAEHTLELRTAAETALFPGGMRNLFGNAETVFHVGDVIPSAGFTITILQMGPAGPNWVRADFDPSVPLGDWHIATERKGRLEPTQLPEIGYGEPLEP